MDPVTAVSTAWAVGSNAVALLRGVAEQAKALGKTEIISSLIDVQMAMMDVLNEQQRLTEENHALRERIRQLEETLQTRQHLEFHHSAYWVRTSDGLLDGPFSTQEWDHAQKLVRLGDYGRDEYDGESKIHFHNVSNKESIFVPVGFLQKEKVPAYV